MKAAREKKYPIYTEEQRMTGDFPAEIVNPEFYT